jgi:hypothetical protein
MLRAEFLTPVTIEVPPRTRFSRFDFMCDRYKSRKHEGYTKNSRVNDVTTQFPYQSSCSLRAFVTLCWVFSYRQAVPSLSIFQHGNAIY